MVFARKYRPKNLQEVIGQPTVVQTIANAYKKNKLHHAYLFVGSMGLGKTTCSRILAAMENCDVSPGLNPCGKCNACQQIFAGTHQDVYEIDAASNAGKVDQIRELKNNSIYSPIGGAKTKYYIIDEAHSASTQAAEALLKLIEEPPPNTRFVLCTTDSHKMIGTIISRCQKHDFRKIFWHTMFEQLSLISKKENMHCSDVALSLCAKLADGSMRNALQLFEKLVDYVEGSEITDDDAQAVFGVVSDNIYCDLFDNIIGMSGKKPNAGAGFKIINNLLMNGTDFNIICGGITAHLDNLLVGMTATNAGDFLHFSEQGKKRIVLQLEECKSKNYLSAIISSLGKVCEAQKDVEFGLGEEFALRKWVVSTILGVVKK